MSNDEICTVTRVLLPLCYVVLIAVCISLLTVVADSSATINTLSWMENNALVNPYQIAAVTQQSGSTTIFLTEGFGGTTCLRQLDNIFAGPLQGVSPSTCSSATGVGLRGVIAIPTYFYDGKVATLGVVIAGTDKTSQINKLFYLALLPNSNAQQIEINGEGAVLLKAPHMMSQPFHWSTKLRFFSPQWDNQCVLLMSTAAGVVDAVSRKVAYDGGPLTATRAAGRCGNPGNFNGAALTEALMQNVLAVAHFIGASGALYLSESTNDEENNGFRRCAPVAEDGGTASAICKKILGMKNSFALRLLVPPTPQQHATLLWGIDSGSSNDLKLVKDFFPGSTSTQTITVETIVQGIEASPFDALLLDNGDLLVACRTTKPSLVIVSNFEIFPVSNTRSLIVSRSVSKEITLSLTTKSATRSPSLSTTASNSSFNSTPTFSLSMTSSLSCSVTHSISISLTSISSTAPISLSSLRNATASMSRGLSLTTSTTKSVSLTKHSASGTNSVEDTKHSASGTNSVEDAISATPSVQLLPQLSPSVSITFSLDLQGCRRLLHPFQPNTFVVIADGNSRMYYLMNITVPKELLSIGNATVFDALAGNSAGIEVKFFHNSTLAMSVSVFVVFNEKVVFGVKANKNNTWCNDISVFVVALTPVIEAIAKPIADSAVPVTTIAVATSAVSTSAGAADAQFLAVMSRMTCAGASIRQATGNPRLLSPMYFDETDEGMVLGNIVLTIGLILVLCCIATLYRFTGKRSWAVSLTKLRLPTLFFSICGALYQGTSFLTVQVVLWGNASVAVVGVIYTLTLPAAVAFVSLYYASASLHKVDYGSLWKKILLPPYRWEPMSARQRFSSLFFRYASLCRAWCLHQFAVMIMLSAVASLQPTSDTGCSVQFCCLALVFIVNGALPFVIRPLFRSRVDTVSFVLANFLSAVAVMGGLAYKTASTSGGRSAAERVGLIAIMCQIGLTVVRFGFTVIFIVIEGKAAKKATHCIVGSVSKLKRKQSRLDATMLDEGLDQDVDDILAVPLIEQQEEKEKTQNEQNDAQQQVMEEDDDDFRPENYEESEEENEPEDRRRISFAAKKDAIGQLLHDELEQLLTDRKKVETCCNKKTSPIEISKGGDDDSLPESAYTML